MYVVNHLILVAEAAKVRTWEAGRVFSGLVV